MNEYKVFKKNSSIFKMLTPLSGDNKLKVAKLITEDPVIISYDHDEVMFLEIAQCPRIYLGMQPECKNIKTNQYEVLGTIVDFQYDESSGYLAVME